MLMGPLVNIGVRLANGQIGRKSGSRSKAYIEGFCAENM